MSTSSNKYRRDVSATNLFHIQHFHTHTHTTLPQFFHTTLPHTTLYINFVTHAHRDTTLSHLFGTYWKKVIFGVFRSFNFRVHWEHVCARKMAIGFSIAVFDHRRAFRAGRVHRVQTTSYGKGWQSNQIAISHQFLTIHARFVREGVGLLGIDRHRAAAKGYGVFRRSFINLHIYSCRCVGAFTCTYTLASVHLHIYSCRAVDVDS